MKYPAHPSKTVYAQDIQCVMEPRNGKGGIYIGNLQASQNLNTLKKFGIRAVLTAAKDILLRHPKSEIPYHMHVPGEDHERFDLAKYFDRSIQFIRDCLKQTNILVHCMAGVSRSVTLVLAYLMKYHNLSYQQAYETVRRRRKIINPNRGFIRQLQEFEKLLQRQAQAMRRSCDNFEARARDESARRTHLGESSIRGNVTHSRIRKNYQTSSRFELENQLRYDTVGMKSENLEYDKSFTQNRKYSPYRSKAQVGNYASFTDINKQLDQKIAVIRKKYMEATDLLNREQRKRTISTTQSKGYFSNLDRADTYTSYQNHRYVPDNPALNKTVASTNQFKYSRVGSYGGYMDNSRRMSNYQYYNY